MKKSYLHVFSVLTMAVLLMAGCRSEIKLDQIDPTIEAQMKVALPLGSLSAKVSDFLKTSDTAEFYIDTLNGDGVVTWQREWKYSDKLPTVDLTSKIASKPFGINLYTKLTGETYYNPYTHQDEPVLQPGGKILMPANCEYNGSIDFDMPLAIDSVNNNLYTVRVDSTQMPVANFTIKVDRDNFNDLNWDWIDTIKLDLSKHIKHAKQGRMVVLYKKGDDIHQFNEPMALPLENITLDLMDDDTKPVGSDNVVDTIHFHTYVKYTIPGPLNAQLYPNSGLKCNFAVNKLEIKAVWGWFGDGKGVTYGENLKISYSPFNFLDGARLPLASPIVEANVETNAAGNFRLTADHLYTVDSANVKHYATWNGDTTMLKIFTEAEGCANPYGPMDQITKFTFRLDSTEANGHIDNLLSEMPRGLVYNVGVNFDKATTPQVRVRTDTYVNAKARVRVPIDFHKGVKISYSDTIKDVNLAEVDLDSLLSTVNWIDTMSTTNIHLFVTLENGIPLRIKGSFYCLDENNQPIYEKSGELYKLFDPAEVSIEGASYGAGSTAQHREIIPAKSVEHCVLTKERLDLFPKIKAIVYTAYLSDETIQESNYGAQISGINSLKVTVGLTADIQAVINVANMK